MTVFEKMLELISGKVCTKPPGLSPDRCHSVKGRINPLCNEYECCRIAEKSVEQLEYICSSIQENIFLRACPGSGKTEVVGLKMAYEIANWDKHPGGIAVLTFTNAAKDVITSRVNQYLGVRGSGHPHFVGTIDSWLHGFIAHPFAHLQTGYQGRKGDFSLRLVDQKSWSEFLNAFKTKYSLNQTGNVPANQYYYHRETDTYVFSSGSPGNDKKRNTVSLKKWQIDDLTNTKGDFYRAGFSTYQDIENLSLELLCGQDCLAEALARRFPLIIVDECQDLSWIQIQILDALSRQGTTLHLVGDLNQSIYDFKSVDPKKVEEYVGRKQFGVLSMSHNFRSCQPIIDICNRIVPEYATTKGRLDIKLNYPCICVTYSKEDIGSLVSWFEKYLDQERIDVSRSAIVTRSWKNVSLLRPSRSRSIDSYQKWLATAVHLYQKECSQALGDALNYLGQFLAEKYFSKYSCNSRKYFCPECVDSSVQWRQFLSHVLDDCSKDTSLAELNQSWSTWAKHVRERFGEIARRRLSLLDRYLTIEEIEFPDLDGKMFRVPINQGKETVANILPVMGGTVAKMRITTIHGVKGETFDAVLVVSAPTKQGTTDGHWTQWIDNHDSQASRLAYVASSRPRHLLAWAVPEADTDQEQSISDLGFAIVKGVGGSAEI